MKMQDKVVEVEIDGEDYTLVASRRILIKMKSICPDLLKIVENKKNLSEEKMEELEEKTLDALYDNANKLFYAMISVKQPQITRKESDEIYEKFCEEYANAEFEVINLAIQVFTQGNPTQKKKILNW